MYEHDNGCFDVYGSHPCYSEAFVPWCVADFDILDVGSSLLCGQPKAFNIYCVYGSIPRLRSKDANPISQ